MMRRLLLAGLIVSIGSFSAFAADDDPKKEEKKPRPTFGGDPEARFKKMDTDSDGKVTKEEFKKSFGKLGGLGKSKSGDMTDKLFDRMDTDKDGKITLDEYKKSQASLTRGLGNFGGANGKLDPERLKQLLERFKKKTDN